MLMILSTFFVLFLLSNLSIGGDQVPVFPERPIERYIIYESLIFFWAFIIALIIIIRMKLKEIERVQKMGLEKEEKDIPFLD